MGTGWGDLCGTTLVHPDRDFLDLFNEQIHGANSIVIRFQRRPSPSLTLFPSVQFPVLKSNPT